MRRVLLLTILALVPLLALGPGMVRANSSSTSYVQTPIREHAPPKKACPKKGKSKAKKCKAPRAKKPTPKPTATPKKRKTKPAPPAKTATPKPTKTPSATSTPTSTPSPTPTITLTPTPPAATALLQVQTNVPVGYVAAFFVCGLPNGVTATFSPNPAIAQHDESSATAGSARSTLTLSSSWQASANQYGLEIWAFYENAQGVVAASPPGGTVEPHTAVLTVSSDRQATVSGGGAIPATGFANCSPIPSSFQPSPVPPVFPSQIAVSSSVSNAHPAAGESVQVSGQIKGAGQGLANVPVHFAWFGPQPIPACDALTNGNGIATCSRVNANPLSGYRVLVQVTFQYGGNSYTSYTSYTM